MHRLAPTPFLTQIRNAMQHSMPLATADRSPLTTTANVPAALIHMERLAPAERPRERLRSLGPRSLGAAELLAVILGSGTRGRSSLTIAHDVLAEVGGSLRVLAGRPVATIFDPTGFGSTT